MKLQQIHKKTGEQIKNLIFIIKFDRSVLVDYINITGKAQNARIVQAFDVELYQKKLVQYFAD